MTRRLTVTMVALVAGALVVATLLTLFVTRVEARDRARRELGRQAERLARRMEVVQRGGLAGVQVALRLEDGAIACIGPTCRGPLSLPAGLSEADLEVESLRRGEVVTGTRRSLAFAAAAAVRGENLMVVVLTRRLGDGQPALGPGFVLVSAAVVLAAAAAAANLGRRLARPLDEARAATRRIAAGDLAARAPENPADGEELVELSRSINAMAESLERSRGLERQFLLSVSHDLRTPLTSIRGYAEALTEGRASDPAHAAAVITAEARRLERLVADLLELAKLDARRFSLDVRGVDADEVVSDTVEAFRPAAEAAGVDLAVASGAGTGGRLASADPDRLAQVLSNLVENALKFATSAIEVGAAADGPDGVVVWVDDDGPGIAAEDLAHVFEPFWASRRAPARQVGTGLGLAIVAELVSAMGATVTAGPGARGGARLAVALRPWQVTP